MARLSESNLYPYWGKASRDRESRPGEARRHPLVAHCLDVGAVARVLVNAKSRLVGHWAAQCGLPPDDFSRLIVFAAIAHDCGKLGVRFQGLCPDLMPPGLQKRRGKGMRHDAIGTAVWQQCARDVVVDAGTIFSNIDAVNRTNCLRLLDLLMSATICHHGKPTSCNRDSWARETYPGDPVRDRAIELFDIAARCAGLPVEMPTEPSAVRKGWQQSSWWISGLAVLADWIGSNQEYFPYFDHPMDAETYWRERALPLAQAAVEKSGVLEFHGTTLHLFNDLFPDISPRPLQVLAENLPLSGDPECLILEDVPGTGKTEAALLLAARYLAEGQGEGIYFALPTMATANAMYDRVAGCYQRLGVSSLSLAHSASRLNDGYMRSSTDVADADSAASCTSWIAQSNKRALLAPISVGTIDQVLLSVLPNRHQNLRLSGLADKILIVDEVHACDEYVLKLLRELLTRHAASGGSAILLSATLPRQTRQALASAWFEGTPSADSIESPNHVESAYPLLTQLSAKGFREIPTDCPAEQHRSLPVSMIASEDGVLDALIAHANAGGCAAWVRNTVGDAIRAWNQLAARIPADHRPILFHARFALGDRLARETEVLKKFGKESTERERSGRILIATQVIEQSLDLDFDLLASDLAPIDLMIQRAGRCRRHSRDARGNPSLQESRRDGRLLLVSPDPDDQEAFAAFLRSEGKGSAAVYPHHHHLWRTARLLARRGRIAVPEDARSLVEAVYDEDLAEETPAILQRAADRASGEDAAMRCLAANNTLRFKTGYVESSAVAWGDDEYTPTRLGEPTTRLRLARWESGFLRPWLSDADHPWELSEVSVRSFLVGDLVLGDDALRTAVDSHIKEHGELRGGKLLPLSPAGDDWCAHMTTRDSSTKRFIYNSERGLTWE
jgi:CRISPR-associated endonuclease/helicase Cas3